MTDRPGAKETALAKRPFSHHKNYFSVCVRVRAVCIINSIEKIDHMCLQITILNYVPTDEQFETPNSLEIQRKTSNRATLKHHLFWSVYVSLFYIIRISNEKR